MSSGSAQIVLPADPLALLRFALHLTADWLTTTVREGAEIGRAHV